MWSASFDAGAPWSQTPRRVRYLNNVIRRIHHHGRVATLLDSVQNRSTSSPFISKSLRTTPRSQVLFENGGIAAYLEPIIFSKSRERTRQENRGTCAKPHTFHINAP